MPIFKHPFKGKANLLGAISRLYAGSKTSAGGVAQSLIFDYTTRLYQRNTTLNGQTRGGTSVFDLLTTRGNSTETAIVNTTVAGSEIQFTKTAGGAPLAFISPRFAAPYTVTGFDIANWFSESMVLVNAGARYRFYRWRAGVETEFTGSPSDSGVEFTTTNALYKWAASVTALEFIEDDRLLVVPYAVNVGVMAMGTATLYFNGVVPELSASVADSRTTGTEVKDLDTYAFVDWVRFYLGSLERKAIGGSTISNQSNVGAPNAPSLDSDGLFTFAWTGGTPTSTQAGDAGQGYFVEINTTGQGRSLTLPAGVDLRVGKFFTNHYQCGASVRFTLSDGSAAPVTVPLSTSGGNQEEDNEITFSYRAASEGQTLLAEIIETSGSGFRVVSIRAAGWAFSAVNNSGESYINVYPAINFKAEPLGSTFNVAIDDSVATSDAFTAVVARAATIADTAASNEEITAVKVAVAAIDDTMATSDSLTATAIKVAAIVDSATSTDDITNVVIRIADIQESAASTDAMSASNGGAIFSVSIDDSLSTSDDMSEVASFAVTITDTSAATDTITETTLLNASIVDSTASTDAMTAVAIFVKSIADSLSASETVSSTVAFSEAIVESVATSDDASATKIAVSVIGDSIVVSEIVAGVKVTSSSIADALATSDAMTAQIFVALFLLAATGRIAYAKNPKRTVYAESKRVVVAAKNIKKVNL